MICFRFVIAELEVSRPWVPDPVPGAAPKDVPRPIRMVRLPQSMFRPGR
jgi:hypothetical protein